MIEAGAPTLPADSRVPDLARAASAAGGRLLVVGGWVRDQLLGERSKDLDLEIFGLEPGAITGLLEAFDSLGRVGRDFPVWRLRHQDVDIAYPREGALDYRPARPDSLAKAFQRAARHRDLTINAIAWDPLDQRWIDPWQGIRDLERRHLRAVDRSTFGSDPLRVLRVARLHAALDATVDPETLALCQGLDLSQIAIERVAAELRRILIEPDEPSRALHWLDRADQLTVFPLVAALRDVPQDPRWHPEGDVFVHTAMVVDQARKLGSELPLGDREILQWAALTHDLGKPSMTTRDGERVRSIGHEAVSARLAHDWLRALRLGTPLVAAVEVLVAHHLAPSLLARAGAGARAYRRLARKLALGGVTLVDLERLARADALGRTTEDARAGRFVEGDRLLTMAEEEGIAHGVRPDVVTARLFMKRGLQPGPALGRALARARMIQDEHGWQDPDRIADRVLAEIGRAGQPGR